MAYLNWTTEKPAEFQVQLNPGLAEIQVDEAHRKILLQNLTEEMGYELRMDLPQGWAIYWKIREGDSRLLMSHPEKDQWVGAVSLNREDFDRLVVWIQELPTRADPIRLSQLKAFGSFSGISNLEVLIRFLK